MNVWKKQISLFLAVALIFTSTLTGCGDLGGRIKDFYSGLFGRSGPHSFTDEARMPDRPYIIEKGQDGPKQVIEYLAKPQISAEEILLEPELEEQIMSATELDEIADTKTKVDNLKNVKKDLEILAKRIKSDENVEESLKNRVFALADRIGFLLTGGILAPEEIEAYTALIGTWAKPDKVILRWSPQMDWVPEDGYNLYRVLQGKTELLSEGLGTQEEIEKAVSLKHEFAEYIKHLYDNSRATPEVLRAAGVSTKDEFNKYIVEKSMPVLNRYRFSGAEDFARTRDYAFTVKATLADRVPSMDLSDTRRITLKTEVNVLPLSIGFAKNYGFSQSGGIISPPGVEPQISDLVKQVMQSRNDLLTKANTDMEFARASGFGYEDDLRGKNIEKGTMIEYVLVPQKPELKNINLAMVASGSRPEGSYSARVEYGKETPLETPAGFTGYGVDNVVNLRWTPPSDEYAKSIISGYYIERKNKKERKFSQLNEVPVTISYMRDENGILYEMPVFYSDLDISNDESALYRIRALDIFGRLSEYSEEINIDVYKVTPPNTPNVDQPSLSIGNLARTSEYIQEAANINKGKAGFILPISKTSNDTEEFAIFRSQALGTGSFENPVEIARIAVMEPKRDSEPKKIVRYGKVRLLVNPSSKGGVHTVFFDQDIDAGYYYKYWVAAVDKTGNESAWSSGRVIGYPTENPPAGPYGSTVDLKRNTLPELMIDTPGFFPERIISGGEGKETARTEFALQAKARNVSIGVSLSDVVRKENTLVPHVLSSAYSNLPDPIDIHDVIAFEGKDLLSGGTARVSWYHHAGKGLKGYQIYRAYVENKTIEELTQMSRQQIVETFSWDMVGNNLKQNLLMDSVEQKSGRIYLYLVFLLPEGNGSKDSMFEGAFNVFEPAGWLYLNWQKPQDPQVGYYRVYRSEVPFFTDGQDAGNLEWTLVADNVKYTGYNEKVDQTFAHYYYYRITSVSIWGVESEESEIVQIRVPATSPPQTPSMLLPFAQKGTVKIQWVGVPHASKYTIYRTKLPKIEEEDVMELEIISPELFTKVFTPVALKDSFLTERMFTGIKANFKLFTNPATKGKIVQNSPLPLVSKFNTVQLLSKKTTINHISQVKTAEKVEIYKNIVDKYGILAVVPYGQLDLDMAKLVIWEKIKEIDIPLGEDSSGVFDYTDEDVLFGDTWLYTVQAENNDNLSSGRPDPVSVSPRKAAPFPPVTGLKGEISEIAGNRPKLTWNSAKDPNLTWKESRSHIVGYIVYKSNSRNGTYYQTSPLLTEPVFIDRNADVYAANWYKVRIVDTGGFTSNFSEAVKVQKLPLFLIPTSNIKKVKLISKIDPVTNPVQTSGESAVMPVSRQIAPIIPIIPLYPDTLTINGFTVTGLSADTVKNGRGDGILQINEKFQVDVTVDIARREGTVIRRGTATLKEPATFGDTGVYFRELVVDTSKAGALASGYVKSEKEGNLIGDLFSLTFQNAEMNTAGVIKITRVPWFHYDNLTFKGAEMATVNLGGITQPIPADGTQGTGLLLKPPLVYGSSFISFITGKVENNLDMDILDNKGLELSYGILGFDSQGRLNGKFELEKVQTVRTVVPAGLGIKVSKAALVYADGVADTKGSFIGGKVMLPFDTFEDSLPVEFDPNLFIKTFSDKNIVMTDIKLHNTITRSQTSDINLNIVEKDIVDRGMYYLASRIQASSLKVLPMDIAAQEKLSTVPFSVTNWGGKGFVIQETTMTPALVGKSEEEIGVTPGKVALDLSAKEAYTGQAPAETKDPDWMGIVVKNGRVGLPTAFIMTENNTRVMFNLTPGELIYDRNGFFYQNQAYSPEGIPVNFGDALGGFQDVLVNLIYLDIYNNITNLEIQGEMGIPLFAYQRAKVRLYTSMELGKLVCSVAQTDKFDPSGTGNIFIKILGGHLQPDGLHMDGTIDLVFKDKVVATDMQFTELVVPADMEGMTQTSNTEEIYGRALFDKPYRLRFHDFEMDVRALSLDSTKQSFQAAVLQPMLVQGIQREIRLKGLTPFVTPTITFYRTELTFWGGMQLSDNLAMDSNENFDRIVIGSAFTSPAISYEESKSKLDFVFEDFASVKTVATPVINSDNGLIEYNTDGLEMVFNSANSLLAAVPVEANVRLGYDKVMSRYFFALGIYYHDPTGGIQFGFGTLNDITGVIGYNLDLVYASDTGYSFPNSKNGFFNSIDHLEVNRTPGGNYFFAATAWMYLGYNTGSVSVKLGEIRNIYMVVEKGPIVEMGGNYYGPSTIQAIKTGKDLKMMGIARLGYYHNERLFKFSLSLYDFGMYGCKVNGDLGFEMCPKYWEIRIGYPEMLVATMGGYTGGFGFAIRYSDYPNDSFIKAGLHFGYDTGDVNIWPVYFRAYLFAGGSGEYYFDSGDLILFVYIEGGLEGGIKVAGKKYKIIHMMVGADGTLKRSTGDWSLDANVQIWYHLDLFLKTVSGSVNWHVSKSF